MAKVKTTTSTSTSNKPDEQLMSFTGKNFKDIEQYLISRIIPLKGFKVETLNAEEDKLIKFSRILPFKGITFKYDRGDVEYDKFNVFSILNIHYRIEDDPRTNGGSQHVFDINFNHGTEAKYPSNVPSTLVRMLDSARTGGEHKYCFSDNITVRECDDMTSEEMNSLINRLNQLTFEFEDYLDRNFLINHFF